MHKNSMKGNIVMETKRQFSGGQGLCHRARKSDVFKATGQVPTALFVMERTLRGRQNAPPNITELRGGLLRSGRKVVEFSLVKTTTIGAGQHRPGAWRRSHTFGKRHNKHATRFHAPAMELFEELKTRGRKRFAHREDEWNCAATRHGEVHT